MDDISWPPNKRSHVKIVPGPRTQLDANKNTNIPTESSDNSGHPPDELPPPVDEEPKMTPPKPSKRHPLVYLKHLNLSKKQWALLIAALIILLIAAGFGGWKLYKHFSKTPEPAPAVVVMSPEPEPAPPPPTSEASKLTGVQVAIGTNNRPVTGIMIENSPDARPQSGLREAGVIYEAIAEGGITRFLALFQEDRPSYIGPVRSVRPYYLDFLAPFDAGIAHVGGAPQALAEIKAQGIKDLDQFANSGSYARITNRFAPHNVYTDFDKMDALNQSKGFNSSTFTGFERKAEEVSTKPGAKRVNFAISSPLYNVRYDYNADVKIYSRSEGGVPHKDERSGQILGPKVVVALVMTRGKAADGQHTEYGVNGSGHMYVFQDGVVEEGTWKKDNRKAQFVFINAAGQALKFNAGQTWITIVDGKDDVTYNP